MSKVSATARTLLSRANIGVMATLMPDGSPQTTAVWVDVSDEHVLVATTTNTLKYANLARDPRVALTVVDRTDPYLEVNIRGRVIAVHEQEGEAYIDRLSQKYYGVTPYPYHKAGDVWVMVVIEVLRSRTNKEVPVESE